MKTGLLILFLVIGGAVLAQSERMVHSGNEYYRKGEFKKAVEEYGKVPEKDRQYNSAKFNTANALYKQDQKVEAVQLFSALGRDAGNNDLKARSFYNKGVILSQQKNLEESIEAYKNALRIDPADREARENLQKALLELRKKPPPPKKEEKKEQKKQEQQQNQRKKPQSKMSPKEAEQRLKLLQQKEKEVQQRLQHAKSRSGGGMPKDW